MRVAIESYSDADSWAQACADRLADVMAEAIARDGRAVFAGSGGSTPTPIYRRLAQAPLDWSRVTATLIDERYVPFDHADSNARLLSETLLTGPAAAARFIPLYRPAITVDRAAAEAAIELAEAGGCFDAVLLGMGEDGHICSMFPDSPTLKGLLTPSLPPSVRGVPAGRDGSAPPQERLTINLAYLTQADRVILALKGATKRAVFEREAQGDPATQPIAALLAHDVRLDVIWTEA